MPNISTITRPPSRPDSFARVAPASSSERLHRLDLVLSRNRIEVTLSGQVDVLAADALERTLTSLRMVDMPLHVDLSAVTFLDSSGIAPLVAAARDRGARQLAPVCIDACSRAADRVLRLCGFGTGPLLDLDVWDSLARR